jgi:hypothetical protein
MPLIGRIFFDSLKLLFLFDHFLEARAEILKKFLLVFWKKQCLHKIISVFTKFLRKNQSLSPDPFFSLCRSKGSDHLDFWQVPHEIDC